MSAVPADLKAFGYFCLAWAVIVCVGIYFAIKFANEEVTDHGDRTNPRGNDGH